MREAEPIEAAVRQLSRFPGIGRKTATRLVYWLLRAPQGTSGEFASAIKGLEEGIVECQLCCTFTSKERCDLCCSKQRDDELLCVVEHPQDVLAFERSGEFRGRYHVLHGALSPLDGVTQDKLRIESLMARLSSGGFREVILAMDPDVEGDTTALYLSHRIEQKNLAIRLTRLAHGIAVGTEIEYANVSSLTRAFENRREF